MLECPPYISIRNKVQSLFETVMLRSFKIVFELDHQVNINLYLMDATTPSLHGIATIVGN